MLIKIILPRMHRAKLAGEKEDKRIRREGNRGGRKKKKQRRWLDGEMAR